MEAFLTEQKQQVMVGGSCSDWISVLSGFPQGSVVAPTLFILYVNDLPTVLNYNVMVFDDDSILYQAVCNQEDMLTLQANLDIAVQWGDEWQLKFNDMKCKVLRVGRHIQQHMCLLNGKTLQVASEEKDLGMIVDVELKFRRQAASAVNRASRVMAVIRRSFSLLDKTTLPTLFKTLVRPLLEYGNIM